MKISEKKRKKLLDQAEHAVQDAFDSLLFEAFGNRLYTELSRAEQEEWDGLFDELFDVARGL